MSRTKDALLAQIAEEEARLAALHEQREQSRHRLENLQRELAAVRSRHAAGLHLPLVEAPMRGRIGFRRNFPFGGMWHGRRYATKQVKAYSVEEGDAWLVITVVVKYFGERETH